MDIEQDSSSQYVFGEKDELMLEKYLQEHQSERNPKTLQPKPKKQLKLSYEDCTKIQKQVQFYLSPANLLYDTHLKQQLSKNKDKWLNINYLFKCNKICKILANSASHNLNLSENQCKYVMKGNSKRAKIRMMRSVLSESEGLIVKKSYVRSVHSIYHKKTKDKTAKENAVHIIDEVIIQQKDQKKEFKSQLSQRQLKRILYIQLKNECTVQEIQNIMGKIDQQYMKEKISKESQQLVHKQKKMYEQKISQKSRKWMLLSCNTPEYRQFAYEKLLKIQKERDIFMVLDAKKWVQYEKMYQDVRKSVIQYLKNHH